MALEERPCVLAGLPTETDWKAQTAALTLPNDRLPRCFMTQLPRLELRFYVQSMPARLNTVVGSILLCVTCRGVHPQGWHWSARKKR